MVTIKSYQDRDPRSNSMNPTRFFDSVNPTEFSVTAVKVSSAGINQITMFFPHQKNPAQGLGLEMAAPEAVALAHALLAVAQGNLDEITGKFQSE